MNTTALMPTAPHAPVFKAKPKSCLRRIKSHVDEEMYAKIVGIAQAEGLGVSSAIRELITIALRFYEFHKGTLNPLLPANGKTFYCQICAQLTSNRRCHRTQVMNEEYQFCEDCFFADKHKSFISMMLNR